MKSTKPKAELRAALYSTVDQVFSSASNALLLFTLARVSTVAEFGIAALFVSALATWTALGRGALGTPLLLVSGKGRAAILSESGHAVTFVAMASIPAVFLLLGLGFFAGDLSLAISFAVITPAVMVQDVLRHAAIASGSARSAALADGLWLLVMLLLYLANVLGVAYGPEFCVGVAGAAAVVSAAILIAATGTRPIYRGIWSWWSTYRHARMRFGVVQGLVPTSTMLVTFAVTTLAGAAVAGGIRGAAALFGPIATIVAAIPLVVIPRARRAAHTPRQQWASLAKAATITSSSTLLVTACLLAVPASVGRMILGDTWEPAIAVAPFLGFSSASGCWVISIYVLFQALGQSASLLRLILFQVVMQLTVVCSAAAYFGTTTAVAIALASTAFTTAVIGVVLAFRAVRRASDAPSDSAEANIAGLFD